MKIKYNIQTAVKENGFVPECTQVPVHDDEVVHFKDHAGRTVIRVTSMLAEDEEVAEEQELPEKPATLDWWTL